MTVQAVRVKPCGHGPVIILKPTDMTQATLAELMRSDCRWSEHLAVHMTSWMAHQYGYSGIGGRSYGYKWHIKILTLIGPIWAASFLAD